MEDPRGPVALAWLREREQEMTGLLERLALVESPTAEPHAQEAVLSILADELGTAGLTARLVGAPGEKRHLFARPRGRARGAYQLLVGHSDTVWPLGTLARMPVGVEDGCLYGPGVYDMKGGLVQLVFALRALADLGWPVPAAPVVFVNGDEESGSLSSDGYLRLLAAGAARAFVLEPSWGRDGLLKTGRKGAGRFRVVVRGKASHAGSEPGAGTSAILELSHQVRRLFAMNDPERGISVNVGTVDGGLEPNVVAPEASAVVDVRARTRDDAETIERKLRSLEPVSEGASIEVEGHFGRPPMEPNLRNLALWRQAAAVAAELGLAIDHASDVGGASDGNTTSLFTPTLDGLGPVGAGAHAAHEHVVVARMPERAALLALLLASPLAAAPDAADGAGVPVQAAEAISQRGAVYGSVTRLARLERRATACLPAPRAEWATGDYVAGELLDGPHQVETPAGRVVEVVPGDLVVGALGSRFATLEVTGDWALIGDDLEMAALSRSGVFGKCTSVAPSAHPHVGPYRYRGHLLVNGRRVTMKDFVEPEPAREFSTPTILVVGTSMESGKTTSAKRIIRTLKERGLRVAGAKLTGVARYRDILTMRDAGADEIVDLVDAGLPSTICPGEEFASAARLLLSRISASDPDVAVIEAGASPLEPYNGELAIEILRPAVRCTVLCASDPYSVVGVMTAFGLEPDFVCGRATSTEAGIALVERLADVPALDLLHPEATAELDELLAAKLGLA
jgi:glutamate carboxypeptidase